MISGKTQHIPKNSINITIKFPTNEKKLELIQDGKFQLLKAEIECIAVQKGGECKYFTNP